ncbi:MAG: alcohol dehydrogenase family protein [Alphaproteobacteria bacterium]|nr:alcohol dehydrogenase family protein [Alphaproteobacteria bacterium]
MHAVHLTGHGGIEKLVYKTDVPVPEISANEVLVKVRAAGVNNTDINTRIGWYSKSVTADTSAGGADGFDDVDQDDASWSGEPLVFPRIQGADASGVIVAAGADVNPARVGERVLCRTMMQDPKTEDRFMCWTMGSECDGAFAQYLKVRSSECFAINSDWSDVELASIPCAYSTAENMLHRIGLGAETVLITGASGGVGSAAIGLAKRRGAKVIAVAGASKADAVKALGADQVIDRNADLIAELGTESIDVVVDLVAGGVWPSLLEVMKRGGRYIASGAIGGPMVELDVRTLYLKALTLMGSTFQDKVVFENLIGYIERNEITPVIAATFPLDQIGKAQEMFLAKNFVGKIVLTVPQDDA